MKKFRLSKYTALLLTLFLLLSPSFKVMAEGEDAQPSDVLGGGTAPSDVPGGGTGSPDVPGGGEMSSDEPGHEEPPEPQQASTGESKSAPMYTGTWNNPVQNGTWAQDPSGVWHYSSSENFRNTWGYVVNPYALEGQSTADWFWFDQHGNILTGWQFINGKWYYLNPASDGTLGACLIGPGFTPDGYEIDALGAWIEK